MRRGSAIHPLSAGRAAELLVQAHAMLGTGYRLGAYEPVADDDHIDLVVMEKGEYGSLYVQVKSCDGVDHEGRVVVAADYEEARIPESPRLIYVVCLIDVAAQSVVRAWVVPSAELNRRAYRQHRAAEPGRVTMQFSCRAGGDPVWDEFEVPVLGLGLALEARLEAAPADAGIAGRLGIRG